MKDLQYVIVPGQWPEPSQKEIYAKVYRCWEDVWSKAYIELHNNDESLRSDAFTRQDYVGAVLYKGECIALSFFRWIDTELSIIRRDSYFANWGETHIKKLCSRGSRVMVCSYFTIAPSARGAQLGVSMKDLLVGLSLRVFLESGADAMTGALRRDRHVNEACARWGGVEIAREIPSGHGDYVDLMGFFQKEIRESHPRPESALVDQLWRDRMYVASYRQSMETEKIAA